MKIAVAIDSLLLRDDSTFLLELVLNIFPNCEIYTIVHRRGGILGEVERRPIVSSFLTSKAKGEDGLAKDFWILPSAVKAIPIHPSIEKIIVISRGYIHGLKLPPQVESYLYLLDWDLVDQKNLGWQKFFAPYVNAWREKALTRYRKIAVSSNALKDQLGLPNAEVIEPTYRTEEYPFVRDEDHNFQFTHQLVFTHGLGSREFTDLARVLTRNNETIRVLGPDAHLTDCKKEFPLIDFAGDHCEATSALYSHQAKAIWDFSQGFFPAKAFGALATGRPVVVRGGDVQKEFLKSGTYFLNDFSAKSLEETYQAIDREHLTHDRKVLRRAGLRWNERLFKSRMVKFLERQKDG
ncbi:MAG TPA: hypothetical protein VNJ01_06750 [Bacteriovoracaceae bacterium]|nr:hypothetical protein [Bacteriovoracaceae bacterium]